MTNAVVVSLHEPVAHTPLVLLEQRRTELGERVGLRILGDALKAAADSGDVEAFQALNTPEGAKAAIALAAQVAQNEAIKNRALAIIAGRSRP